MVTALESESQARPPTTFPLVFKGDMWRSKEPVFAPSAFSETAPTFLETSSLCLLLVKMARPLFIFPEEANALNQFEPIGISVSRW